MADSPAVVKLKVALDMLSSDRTDWASNHRKKLRARIRAQRLREARDRGTHEEGEWSRILARYEYRCVRCGCVPTGRPCKDHITPLYLGGSDAADNLQPLCRECNTSKGAETFNWAAYRDEHGFDSERETC